MLKRVHIKNYKSLQDVAVELSPFTVLIGPNNAGKSNFLDALKFLSDIVQTTLPGAFDTKRGSFESVIWQGDTRRKIEVQAEGDFLSREGLSSDFTYAIAVALDPNDRGVRIWEESLPQVVHSVHQDKRVLLTDDGSQASGTEPKLDATALSLAFKHPNCRRAQAIQQFLASWRIYHLNPDAMRTPDAADSPAPILESRGANLAAVLDSFMTEHRQSLKWLEATLQRAIPETEGLRLRPTPDRKKIVSVAEKNGGGIVEASALSDGILRFLALLSLVYHPQPPPLICIEEPENGIHPRRLEKVVDLLKWLSTEREPSQRAQVIVTTHSPSFLDWFRDHPEWVWIVERKEGASQFRCLTDVRSKQDLEQLLDEWSLGEAWYAGSIGGVP